MTKLTHKYFWMLGNDLPKDVLSDYEKALKKKNPKSSKLLQSVMLANKGCPITPQLFCTPAAIAMFKRGSVKDEFLDELATAIEFLERGMQKGFGESDNPAIFSIVSDRKGNIKNIGINDRNLNTILKPMVRLKPLVFILNSLKHFLW
jgi:hypothetical protein